EERLRLRACRDQAPVLPILRGPDGRPETRAPREIQFAHRRHEPVRHDQLDIHLVQPARRWYRRRTRSPDERDYPLWRGMRQCRRSCEAAEDFSPRRKWWAAGSITSQVTKGRKTIPQLRS